MAAKRPYQLELVSPWQESLPFADPASARNRLQPVHRWVSWVAGYSSYFVKDALSRYATRNSVILDPFAGVGTTLIESLFQGHHAIGFEINPYAAFVSQVKVQAWQTRLSALRSAIARYRRFDRVAQKGSYIPKSVPPQGFRSRSDFFAPAVLRKVLILLDYIDQCIEEEAIRDLFRLAFAATMISYSQYSYEPSLSRRVTAGKSEILDADVCGILSTKLSEFAEDISLWKRAIRKPTSADVHNDTFFNYEQWLEPESIDIVITSPPYLNNYHYSRNTRPHIFWLGLAQKPSDMKYLEHASFGKFWQTVRDQPEIPLNFTLPGSTLQEIIATIRSANSGKGIYGGAGWANYAACYFNDCYRFVNALRNTLRSGGHALVVIGNSILQGVFVPTDLYFSQIAQLAGLEIEGSSILRTTRVGNSIIRSTVRVTAAQESHTLYEAVIVLRRP